MAYPNGRKERMQVHYQCLMICGTRFAIGHSFKLFVPVMSDSGCQHEGDLGNTTSQCFNRRTLAHSIKDTYTAYYTVT